MAQLIRFYKLLNVLSIDVAVGALISALFFAKIFHVTILPYGKAALVLTVWIVYTADHLRDAKQIQKEASTARHFFHQRYFKPIFICMVIAILVDITMLFFLRKQVFFWGLLLSLCVCVYLAIQSKFPYVKEMFVAALYTAGVLLPALVLTDMKIGISHHLVIIQFFLIALLNLLVYSWYDADTDRKDGLRSIVTYFDASVTKRLIVTLMILTFILIASSIAFFEFSLIQLTMLLMLTSMLMITKWKKKLQQHDLYRIAGDAVFFIPAIMLL
jgi:4-hydroxybenzoate polyprenyltransferase